MLEWRREWNECEMHAREEKFRKCLTRHQISVSGVQPQTVLQTAKGFDLDRRSFRAWSERWNIRISGVVDDWGAPCSLSSS